MERDAAKHGLGFITAAVFLAGEMAGSGVLALPFAMTGTGKNGLTLFYMTLKITLLHGHGPFYLISNKYTKVV